MRSFFFKRKNKSILALAVSFFIILYYTIDIDFNNFFKKSLIEKKLNKAPVSVSKNVEIIKYNKEGKISHQINASQIVNTSSKKNKSRDDGSHINKTNSHIFELLEPKIKFYSKKNGIIKISADFGNISQDSSTIDLSGNVLMIDDYSSLIINASNLKINIFLKKIHVSDNIVIKTPTSITKAKKIDGTLNDQKYILEGDPIDFFHKKNQDFDAVTASAKFMEFQPDKDIVKFKNDVLINKSDYEVSGEEIIYYIKERRISTNNEAIKPNSRVKAIIKQNIKN